ncbi:MAG: serine--tRNA ligase, partial [Bryobacteraceae bacterium]
MLDLAYVRNNLEAVAARLATRGASAGLEQFRELDQKRRAAITEEEQLRAQNKAQSERIGQMRREGADATAEQEAVRASKARLAVLEEEKKAFDDGFRELLAGIPNLPHESVPVGK